MQEALISPEQQSDNLWVTTNDLRDYAEQIGLPNSNRRVATLELPIKKAFERDIKKIVTDEMETEGSPEPHLGKVGTDDLTSYLNENRSRILAKVEDLRSKGIEVYSSESDRLGYYAYYFDSEEGPIQILRIIPVRSATRPEIVISKYKHDAEFNLSGLAEVRQELGSLNFLGEKTAEFFEGLIDHKFGPQPKESGIVEQLAQQIETLPEEDRKRLMARLAIDSSRES